MVIFGLAAAVVTVGLLFRTVELNDGSGHQGVLGEPYPAEKAVRLRIPST
ncbi:MAG: hypothetical protein JW940_13620 [Polyangiaceae bacterium]|nr:hypothetical protein [Polyangiaceae bacterium]